MQILFRVLKWVLISIIALLLVVFVLLLLDRDYQSVELSKVDKNSIEPREEYDPNVDPRHYLWLLEEYGKNKTLPDGFEWQCLLALSHYPELKETHIDFLVEPAFLPLASRPDPKSILFPWIKRKYLVIISDESADFFEPILLENTPINEQIGIIGHELGHTIYYLDKSALQMAWIAYKYQFDNSFKVDFEREADKIAVAHGLGYQMYDFAWFVRRAFGQSEEEIEAEEGDMYLSPKEILMEMEKYDLYSRETDLDQ